MKQCGGGRLQDSGYAQGDEAGVEAYDGVVILMNPLHQAVADVL